MDLYTFQLAKWRLVKARGIPYLDTTVKSGVVQLAPHWDLVLGSKSGAITPEQYRVHYYRILDHWRTEDPEFWTALLARETVAFGCYCKPNTFCHRHLLVEYIKNITEVNYLGEITT